MLKNHMEDLVNSHLPAVIKEYDHLRNCEKCQNDIKAIALNHLKPLYIMTDRGLVFTKLKELDQQFQSDIIQELVKAMNIVESNPNHGDL